MNAVGTVLRPYQLEAIERLRYHVSHGVKRLILQASTGAGKTVCAEVFFWVSPRYRGHGKQLLTYVENWARSRNCDAVALSRPESATPPLAVQLQRRRLFFSTT